MLSDINQRFLSSHQDTASIYTADIDWIIVYKGIDISLWRRNGLIYECCAQETPSNELRYTRLKQLSHLVVHVTQRLQRCSRTVLESHSVINDMREHLLETLNQLIQPDIIQEIHQEDIVDAMLMIDSCRNAIYVLMNVVDHWSGDQIKIIIDDLILKCSDAIEKNSQKASEIILNHIYSLIADWESTYGLCAKKSRAVVVSPHGPRVERIETALLQQWYRHRMGVAHIDDRLVYNVEVMVSLLGKIDIEKDIIQGVVINAEVNKAIGRDVLKDEGALFRDVLGDYAPSIVAGLMPLDGESTQHSVMPKSS